MVLTLLSIGFARLTADEAVSEDEAALCEKGFGALQESTHTFSANIQQTLSLQGLSHSLISQGMLFYSSPDRLLIRYSQPDGEWMLVNGERVAMKKQGKPVEYRDLSGQGKGASHAANLLDFFHSGTARWHHDFDVSMTRKGNQLLVHLKPWMTPTSTFQGVESIVTTLQLPGYEIVSMDIAMNGANRIRYEFSGVHRNIALDPLLFSLPKNSTP